VGDSNVCLDFAQGYTSRNMAQAQWRLNFSVCTKWRFSTFKPPYLRNGAR